MRCVPGGTQGALAGYLQGQHLPQEHTEAIDVGATVRHCAQHHLPKATRLYLVIGVRVCHASVDLEPK